MVPGATGTLERARLAVVIAVAVTGCRGAEPPAAAPAEPVPAEPPEPVAIETDAAVSPIPTATRQLVLVTSASWDAPTARLRRFTRTSATAPWRPEGEEIPVVLGHAGSAWGRGLHPAPPADEPRKREGDGKSPAGVFAIGDAFGYADHADGKLGYHPLGDADRCVDDPASAHYNRITKDEGPHDWGSAEIMRRGDELYRWVVLIDHNGITSGDTAPGAGSCIFFHVWAGPDRPTVGCTALARPALEALMTWLDPGASPVVVLLPADRYAALRPTWLLP